MGIYDGTHTDEEILAEEIKMYLGHPAWINGEFREMTEDEVKHLVLIARTELWQDLAANSTDFAETGSDYGYGGEVVEYADTDTNALYEFITARERKYLGGKTLEEYAQEVGEHGA